MGANFTKELNDSDDDADADENNDYEDDGFEDDGCDHEYRKGGIRMEPRRAYSP